MRKTTYVFDIHRKANTEIRDSTHAAEFKSHFVESPMHDTASFISLDM